MKNTLKKAISILLAAVMVFGAAPLAGFVGLDLPKINLFSRKAEAVATSGKCGDNLTWIFDESTGELVISGTGDMYDWDEYHIPWQDKRYLIKTVTISDGVTNIANYAFRDCDSLKNLTISNSVTTIDDWAFRDCDSLESITIPDSVISIDYWAFRDCDSLVSVAIGSGLASLDDSVFHHCDSLESITVDSANTEFLNDEYGVLFNKDKTELIQYPIGNKRTDYIVPNSVAIIGDTSFSGCYSLVNITIPDSVINIGISAFSDCDGLVNVTIPDSVTKIGEAAFAGCLNLTSITLSDSITSLGSQTFSDCHSLMSIIIPDGVTSIDAHVFADCKNLKSVVVPDGVTFIGNYAFWACDSLTSITIPVSVTRMGKGVFRYCDSLTDIYYTGTEAEWSEITIDSDNEDLTNITIHYNCVSEEPTTKPTEPETKPVTPPVTEQILSVKIRKPSQKKIEYGDSIILHADIEGELPDGYYVYWYASNGNFTYYESFDGTACTVTPSKSGETVFSVTICDENLNVISIDEVTMTSKAGFFDKIIAFFKKLFGLTKTIPEASRGIY